MEKMSTSIHPLGYHSIFFITPFALHFDKEALLTQGECGTATIQKCSNPSVIGQHPRTQFFEAHRICHEILALSRSRCIGQKKAVLWKQRRRSDPTPEIQQPIKTAEAHQKQSFQSPDIQGTTGNKSLQSSVYHPRH